MTADLSFETSISLTANKSGQIHGLIVSFDCEMIDAPNPIILSTSPKEPATHWKQTGFLFEKPIEVKVGDRFEGKFRMDRNFRNRRELKVYIKLDSTNATVCDQEYIVA